MSRTHFPIVDFHSHYIAPHWQLADEVPQAQRDFWTAFRSRLTSIAALTADIDSGDIDARVINTPTALLFDQSRALPADIFRRINDELAAIAADRPGRLFPLATVDVFSGEEGARELTRAVRELGHVGVFVESGRGDLLLDAPEALPTLRAAAELGVPVFAHPVNPQPLADRLAGYGRPGVFVARGTVNAASLIALLEGGVFDALPDLKVVVTTLAIGGLLLAGGFGDGSRLRHDTPAALRRHVYIDTMGFSPVLIRAAADLIGTDHVLAGSDWPIVSEGPIRPRLSAALEAAGLAQDEAGAIAAGNALSLIGRTL